MESPKRNERVVIEIDSENDDEERMAHNNDNTINRLNNNKHSAEANGVYESDFYDLYSNNNNTKNSPNKTNNLRFSENYTNTGIGPRPDFDDDENEQGRDDDEESDFNNKSVPVNELDVDISNVGGHGTNYDNEKKESMDRLRTVSTKSSFTTYAKSLEDDDGSTIFSGDTFDNTRFPAQHPQLKYVRRGNSTVRPKPPKKKATKILTLDNPIPKGILEVLPRRNSPEFTEMRYTACTADPNDCVEEGYSLRFADMNRECQIAVCITMYNEDKYCLARTLHSIMRNVSYLCKREKSKVWGPNGWKKVQVIIISDGRAKINKGSLDYLTSLGIYQEDMAKSTVNGQAVKAHIFELTSQISIDDELNYISKDLVPVQIVFCLKEENQKKINSHRWLFNAFCPILDSTVVALVDVGTRLNDSALYHMWKAFDMDSNVAGVAGQIKTMKGKYGLKLLNPLVASQNFEYKMSNILDKPLESVFGYISVLPGALSAYRYRALKNHPDGTGPLHSYFLGENQENANRDVFTANMYLAEDRILCWELVAKRDAKWILKYVKEATGETDVPEEPPEFISQRRRWLNGAMFAALYAQLHFYQIWKTKHSFIRKFFFHLEFFYQLVQFLFSWFSIANFFLTFYYLAGSMNVIIKHGIVLFTFFKYLLICTICALFIISMGNRPQGANHLFISSMVILSICSTYALITGLVFSFKTLKATDTSYHVFLDVVVSLLSTYGLYAFTSIMYLDPWHIITSIVQYLLMLPTFVCTLQIFAFCNTHDVSWGTKGSTKEQKPKSEAVVKEGPDGQTVITGTEWPQDIDKKYIEIRNRLKENEVVKKKTDPVEKNNDYYRDVRTRIVMLWMLSNLVMCMIVTQVYAADEISNNKYLAFVLWSVAALALFRSFFSMTFLFLQYLRMIISYKHKLERNGSWRIPKLSLSNPFKGKQ
ncbi:related to Chitin synthase 2 [Saccharomycodes ludwigii]|uniref:Chitin synthase n=2 Tax=Saccharomycodes ludwigii TaxID=36035 RepID=A0A376B9B1_9ASCO|nr:related to Chitin synthase 2 [Saccharomycodes ludwigii]